MLLFNLNVFFLLLITISVSFFCVWRKWLAEKQIQLTTSVIALRAQCKINIGFVFSQLQHSVYK